MSVTADVVIDNFIGRIDQSSIETLPFPHLSITGIFEDELYGVMQKFFPKQQILSAPSSRLVCRYWSFIYPEPQSPQTWDDYGSIAAFWEVMGLVLSSDTLKEAIFKKFNKPLVPTTCTARCVIDSPGYYIAPHIDAPSKVASMLLYMPDDDTHPHWGTSMVGETTPFIQNKMFCFFNDPEISLHWVNEIKEPDAERKQILVIWNEKSEEGTFAI